MTIAFDGECGLCSRWVRFVLARDARRRFRFTSNRSNTGAAIFRESGQTILDPGSMIYIDRDNRRYEKSDAAIRICNDLGGVLRLALIANLMPRRLRDACYDFVARNRYRLFSADEVCRWLPADRMDQFLP
jgi:predicted DCC family thiol-disulfide oxidoreductase YuxK